MTTEPTPDVHRFRKGEKFQLGTSQRVYTVTHNETATGWVRAISDQTGRTVRFSSNPDPLNLYTPEQD
jgi:hypothetical protein